MPPKLGDVVQVPVLLDPPLRATFDAGSNQLDYEPVQCCREA